MNTSKTDDIRSYLDWAVKGRTDWWRYALGVLLLIILVFVGPILIIVPFQGIWGPMQEMPPLKNLIVENLAFLPMLLTPLILAWALHKRTWWSVAVPRPRVQWWNLGMGFLFSLLSLSGLWIFNTLFWGIKITTMPLDLREYLPFVLVAFFFIFIQTTAEELAFRGYVMQALRRMTANPTFIIVLTGVAFALPHFSNLRSLGWPWYGVLTWVFDGCILAWLAYRTGSLWMPFGWHWANNFILISILSVETDVAGGFSIFSAASYPSIELVLLDKIIMYPLMAFIVNYLVSRRKQAGEQ